MGGRVQNEVSTTGNTAAHGAQPSAASPPPSSAARVILSLQALTDLIAARAGGLARVDGQLSAADLEKAHKRPATPPKRASTTALALVALGDEDHFQKPLFSSPIEEGAQPQVG